MIPFPHCDRTSIEQKDVQTFLLQDFSPIWLRSFNAWQAKKTRKKQSRQWGSLQLGRKLVKITSASRLSGLQGDAQHFLARVRRCGTKVWTLRYLGAEVSDCLSAFSRASIDMWIVCRKGYTVAAVAVLFAFCRGQVQRLWHCGRRCFERLGYILLPSFSCTRFRCFLRRLWGTWLPGSLVPRLVLRVRDWLSCPGERNRGISKYAERCLRKVFAPDVRVQRSVTRIDVSNPIDDVLCWHDIKPTAWNRFLYDTFSFRFKDTSDVSCTNPMPFGFAQYV